MTIPTDWVYILICENGSYYTGYTNHLLRRYREHVKGTRKCKYTRSFKPIQLAQSWVFADKVSALKAEKFIKKLTKDENKRLISNADALVQAEALMEGSLHFGALRCRI